MIVAIIQARMGSTRLPGKVAKLILGKPMLAHQIERVKQTKLVDKIIIATSDKKEDDIIEKIAVECGIDCFRGSEKDVLDRFYKAAKESTADVVIRLTGDCPLSDPVVIDEVVNYFLENQVDVSGKPSNYPEGLDTEVLSFSALERAWREAKKPSEREHVTPYIINHPEIFKIKNKEIGWLYNGKKDVFSYHWSVDEPQDFEFVSKIFEELYPKNKLFLMNDVLRFLENKPELFSINKGLTGYEGYQKSLKEDEEHAKNKNKTYIIFEVASTHENDWETAKNYVAQAADAGADALKFQLFSVDKLLAPLMPAFVENAKYFKKAEMPREWFPKLKELCDERGIDLLCTPFDNDSASFLDSVGVPAIKIASGDLTHHQLLSHVAKFGRSVILSTGMATMEEIHQAMETLRANGSSDITLLQCVSVYPTSFEDANVSAMLSLKKEFGVSVGYSDNGSKGLLVPLLAVALGAEIIEKHVTSKKERGSIDDIFSLDVKEFGEMVRRIRKMEKRLPQERETVLKELETEFGENFKKAYGDGIKRPAPHGTKKTNPGIEGEFVQKESDERHWARRGVYLVRGIKKGEKITKDALILLRPDIGISGVEYEKVAGMVAGEDLKARVPLKINNNKIFQFRKADIAKTYTDPEETHFVKMLEKDALFE